MWDVVRTESLIRLYREMSVDVRFYYLADNGWNHEWSQEEIKTAEMNLDDIRAELENRGMALIGETEWAPTIEIGG